MAEHFSEVEAIRELKGIAEQTRIAISPEVGGRFMFLLMEITGETTALREQAKISNEKLKDVLDRLSQFDAMLKQIGESGTCKGCGADIYWFVTKNGKKAPITPAGLNHFVDCEFSDRFRKLKKGAAK